MTKLYINNYQDIKITKVRDVRDGLFCIHFFYNGKHYMLHYNDEEISCTHLYEWNNNKLTVISCAYCNVGSLLRYHGKQLVYSKINLFYFVFMMDYYGLVSSEFHHLVKEWKQKESMLRNVELLLSKIRSE